MGSRCVSYFQKKIGDRPVGGWPAIAQVSVPEGAPSKLRLGGAFHLPPVPSA
jgi:hypothetical protein